MFKESFFEHQKFWGSQKGFGGNCPRITPVSAGLGRTVAWSLPLGAFMFVQSG